MGLELAGAARPSQPRRRDGGAAIGFVVLLLLPGCGIPKLRQALPGPAMPQQFALNNTPVIWGQGTDRRLPEPIDAPDPWIESDDDVDAEGDQDRTDGASNPVKRVFSSIKLTSLIRKAEKQEAADSPEPSPIGVDGRASDAEGNAVVSPGGAVNLLPAPDAGPASWATGDAPLECSSQLPLRAFFDDPNLIGLIEQALVGNQELRILSEEINIANNEVYARSGEYRPFVTFGAGAGLEKSSRFSRAGAVEDQLEAAPGRGFPEPLPDFLVATNISWELDVWKKLRNAQNAAAMRYLGSQEGRNYIVTRLVAEVAETYYELLALDNRLITLQQTIEIQWRSLQVAEANKAAGRGTELAVQRFRGEVRKNQSELLLLRQEIVEAENRINFLVGRYPQPVERALVNYVDLNLTTLRAGLPAVLLRNRADVRQAERQVEAAGLDVRVARARFYPSFGLNAGVGLNAFNMRYLLSTPESLIYNVAIDMAAPLINRRAIKADYRSANAAQLQSVYHYQQTVLTAHIEVVNHLTKVENYRQSIDAKKQQIAALEASVDAANKLFQSARAEYVEVLLAQREMMEARMVLIETKQQQLKAVVNAYQALGGGFY